MSLSEVLLRIEPTLHFSCPAVEMKFRKVEAILQLYRLLENDREQLFACEQNICSLTILIELWNTDPNHKLDPILD